MPTASSVDGRELERPLRILFFLWALNLDRIFEGFLRELLRRGHSVEILFAHDKARLPEGAGESLRGLAREYPSLTWDYLPRRDDPELQAAVGLRTSLDYLRYLEPEYAHADALRARARERVPRAVVSTLDARPFRGRVGRALARRVLERLEASVPPGDDLVALIRERAPDIVLVAPLVALGSTQVDFVRAAALAGIPSALPVASWDNLTNKGVLQELPGRIVVWNEQQVEEAVRLHGVPRDRVAAVGAHAWDHWFEWRPSASRAELTAAAGLEPDIPYLLYVCSSGFIAPEEPAFVLDWLRHLRAADVPELRSIGVIVRPHPQNTASWRDVDLGEPGRAVVWPREGAVPTDDGRKRDYFDSLWHSSGVVGINTSALIESAIVRRPVFTILDPRFRGTQGGTLHFGYLTGADEAPPLLQVADTWDEHVEQLAAALHRPDESRERIEAFLRSFVRPHGLDRPAAPLAAEAIERAAEAGPVPARPSRPLLRRAVRRAAPLLLPPRLAAQRTKGRRGGALRRLLRRLV